MNARQFSEVLHQEKNKFGKVIFSTSTFHFFNVGTLI
jgi:hypothetical protein